jgi:hypothetical protein
MPTAPPNSANSPTAGRLTHELNPPVRHAVTTMSSPRSSLFDRPHSSGRLSAARRARTRNAGAAHASALSPKASSASGGLILKQSSRDRRDFCRTRPTGGRTVRIDATAAMNSPILDSCRLFTPIRVTSAVVGSRDRGGEVATGSVSSERSARGQQVRFAGGGVEHAAVRSQARIGYRPPLARRL